MVGKMGKTYYLNNKTVAVMDKDGGLIEIDNPFPTQDVDDANRNSQNTVFGEKIIGIKKPSITAQFQYGIKSDRAVITNANGGEAVIEDSMLKIRTGTNVAGSSIIQTTRYLRYVPGQEAYMFFTAVYTQGVADSYQRAGLYDSENGFFIGYEGTDFKITRRRDGVDTSTTVDIDEVFEKDTFDPTKGNVYKVSFGYLGFATITFEIQSKKGTWKELGKFEYPNSATETHILQTNLPARAEVANTGNNTNLEMRSGSFSAGIVDGGGTDPAARIFSKSIEEIAIAAGDFEVITFRNKSTYNSIENRITAQLLLLSVATDVNKINSWNIYVNSDFTNTPTWADVSVDSVLEFSTDATVDTATGESQLSWSMGKLDTLFEEVENLLVSLQPNQHATFVITTALGASGTTNLAVRWKELF